MIEILIKTLSKSKKILENDDVISMFARIASMELTYKTKYGRPLKRLKDTKSWIPPSGPDKIQAGYIGKAEINTGELLAKGDIEEKISVTQYNLRQFAPAVPNSFPSPKLSAIDYNSDSNQFL